MKNLSKFIFPIQVVFPLAKNIDLLSWALRERTRELPSTAGSPLQDGISIEDFVRAVTSERVVSCIVEEMLRVGGARGRGGPEEILRGGGRRY